MAKNEKQAGLTPKQTKFCEAYVETGNASEAYRQAFDTSNMVPGTIRNRASELLARDDIRGMVEGLQAEQRERHHVTMESMTQILNEICDEARAAGHYGAAATAAKTVAQMHGLLVNKQEIKASNEHSFNLAESLAKIARLEADGMLDVTPRALAKQDSVVVENDDEKLPAKDSAWPTEAP